MTNHAATTRNLSSCVRPVPRGVLACLSIAFMILSNAAGAEEALQSTSARATQLAPAFEASAAATPAYARGFSFALPLFDTTGAWNQLASSAAVLEQSDQQILTYYRVLCGDGSDLVNTDPGNFIFPDVAFDEFTLPIFRAGSGQQSVDLCDYDGGSSHPNSKWGVASLGGPVTVPSCAGTVVSAYPVGAESDGWLCLYDPATFTSYDFWQASTARNAPCQSLGSGLPGNQIVEAGYADFFDVREDGTNPFGDYSARAMGTPLLAGLILPEDIESGSIDHALAVGIIGPRNLSSDPSEPVASDIFYPAATTETDHYSVNPNGLAAGQRIRAKSSLVDHTGRVIDESSELFPITRLIFEALRKYGAYVVDNAGSFTFWSEDVQTAVVHLSDDEINALIDEDPGTPLASGVTKWQILMEAINDDLWSLAIPFAFGDCNGASSTVTTANFEVVEPAEPGGGGGGGGGGTDPCQANAATLCIDGGAANEGRFRIEVDFDTELGGGRSGAGQAVNLGSLGIDRGGLFWFFNQANPEMLIKILDGCGVNGHFWVFYSAGTSVGLEIRVTDTTTGTVWSDVNPDGRQAPPVADTEAFSCN